MRSLSDLNLLFLFFLLWSPFREMDKTFFKTTRLHQRRLKFLFPCNIFLFNSNLIWHLLFSETIILHWYILLLGTAVNLIHWFVVQVVLFVWKDRKKWKRGQGRPQKFKKETLSIKLSNGIDTYSCRKWIFLWIV